jgi:hypothetical protein
LNSGATSSTTSDGLFQSKFGQTEVQTFTNPSPRNMSFRLDVAMYDSGLSGLRPARTRFESAMSIT